MAVRGRAVSAGAGVSAAGGFLRKKLNMGKRRAWKRSRCRSGDTGAGGGGRLPGPKPVVILVGSGALAQSVRATES